MNYDIFGNSLRSGFCEVHPWVEMPYPCSECAHDDAETRALKAAEDAYYADLERDYNRSLIVMEFDDLSEHGAMLEGGLS